MKARTRWIAVALTLGLSAVVIAQPPATITPALAGVASLLTFGAPVDTGISRTAAGTVAVGNGTQGDLTGTISANTVVSNTGGYTMAGVAAIHWLSRGFISASVSNANFIMQNEAATVGSNFKVDALPTIASGGGGTLAASITAGSTPLAGSVNVGTGVITSPIVINFNGTAFPSAPFVVCQDDSSLLVVRCTATTTQMTIAATALTASDIISWVAISSK